MRHFFGLQLCFLLVSLTGCRRSAPELDGELHAAAGAVAGLKSSPRHSVRVSRNETVLSAFEGAGGTALLDGSHLTIELVSADAKHRLAIEVDGNRPGVYPLAPTFESSKAVIVLISQGTPAKVSPASGVLRLLRVEDGSYGGSFKGTATDSSGYRYAFEGSFSDIPARRL